MYIDTEGIIFKQIKTVNGRRMILLFSKKYGKISAGTSINEKGRGKSALAMRPFTYGKYELFKNKDSYNINGAEVIKSYYSIGEDVDKYMACSYVLELTERILAENQPAPALFVLLTDFLEVMEGRRKRYQTIVIAYQIKALAACGNMPQLGACVMCGTTENLHWFSVQEGGLLCPQCRQKYNQNDGLIYETNFGIVDILKYFSRNPLQRLEKLALDESAQHELQRLLKAYLEYHLDIRNLKSEGFILV